MSPIFQMSISLALCWAACVGCGSAVSAATPDAITVAVVDIDYVDTSGETTDQSAARSHAFADDLRRDLAASGGYRIVELTCGAVLCAAGSNPAELRAAAHAAGVWRVVLVGVHKMSTLVQWGKIVAIDVDKGTVVLDRLLTFRGDTDEAWQKAESFTARDILATALGSSSDAPATIKIKIAVFDFELEDFSGGASIIPESADDAKDLQLATETARRLIAESGRYTLVDVSSANAEPVKIHKLQDCDGCDAAIASGLGAEQSLVGIVTRITRTDYAVTFKLRDAQSAKLIDVEQTDLRIGANYSWDRGAAWLIKNKLLEKQATP